MEQFFTMEEIMEKLKLSRDSVTRIIKSGKIPGTVKLCGMYRIPQSGLDALLSSQALSPATPVKLTRRVRATKARDSTALHSGPITMDIFGKD